VEESPHVSEKPWWHTTEDDHGWGWDEPLAGIITLCPEYGAELPLWGQVWGNIDWHFTKFPLELLDRLATWQEEFDEHYDYETGWRSDVARDHWAEEARALTAELRAALGTRAKLVVELWPLGE
jgi:hypothetical protein